MENKVLWLIDGDEGILLDEGATEKKTNLADYSVRIWNTPYREIELPLTVIDSDGDEIEFGEMDIDEFNDKLDELVGMTGQYADDYADPEHCLAYDYYNKCFCDFGVFDTVTVHIWWDGHNWKTDELGENAEEIAVTLGDSYDLDTWDGHNAVWGGVGLHAIIHKLVAVDGDPEPVGERVLWERWSQWEGSQTTGQIMAVAEAAERLEVEEHPDADDIKEWMSR